MLYKRIEIIFVLMLSLSSSSLCAEVYKWTDENGQTHYSDIPQDQPSNKITVNEKPESSSEPSDADRRDYQKRVLDSFAQERQQKQQKKEEQEKKQAEQRKQCEQARKRLSDVETAGYLYEKDKDGEKVIFTDEQRQAATDQARAAVKQYCN
ncbi:MAG: DUF4124 domain-containing protein [Gammaproteobacteria bacterium]|nr:DUF4124 domain-containing protein [Gammaproteobacteria bacterium]